MRPTMARPAASSGWCSKRGRTWSQFRRARTPASMSVPSIAPGKGAPWSHNRSTGAYRGSSPRWCWIDEGRFAVQVIVDGPLGRGELASEVDATYDLRPAPVLLLVYLLPFLAVGAIWVKVLRRRTLSMLKYEGRSKKYELERDNNSHARRPGEGSLRTSLLRPSYFVRFQHAPTCRRGRRAGRGRGGRVVHRVPRAHQRAAAPGGADPPLQPGTSRRLSRRRIHRPRRPPPRASRGTLRRAAHVPGVPPVRERLVQHRSREGRAGPVDLARRRPGPQSHRGLDDAGLRAQQPSGDGGAGCAGIPRAAAGDGGRGPQARPVLREASAARTHRARGSPAAGQPPRHPVLEHHALSLRRRPRGEVHRPSLLVAARAPCRRR